MEHILLEFTRSTQADDPYAHRFGVQEYLLRTKGGGVRKIVLNWDDALLTDLAELRVAQYDPVVIQRLGDRLHRFLAPTEFVAQEGVIARAVTQDQPVCVTIRSAAAEIYLLPWELVRIGAAGQHLGELARVLVRYHWPETRTMPPAQPQPEGGRILLAYSGAGGLVPADDHREAIEKASQQGCFAFDAASDVLADVTLQGLETTLATAAAEAAPVRILHILAHSAASGDTDSTTFGLCWNRDDGTPAIIDAGRLRQLLASYADQIRLVILSACDSGNDGTLGNHLGSLAQNLHRAGIESVIASRLPLSVRGSTTFTRRFYDELLGRPSSLETAYLAARRALAHDQDSLDWASIQLYARPTSSADDDTRPVVFRPYRGLLPFHRQHARFFFGRTAERNEIIGNLEALTAADKARLLIVAGASGTGKSSAVMAGAIPLMSADAAQPDADELDVARALRTLDRIEHHLPADQARGSVKVLRQLLAEARMSAKGRWDVAVMRVEADPLRALGNALNRRRDRSHRFLLVIDQFEELFTAVADHALRQRFVRRLWSMCREPNGVCCVVTLRVDFLGACGDIVVDNSGLRLDQVAYDDAHRVFVPQLAPEQLRAAIEEPARLVGLALEPGLASTMIEDVGTEPGALPLLQYTLDCLWAQRQGRLLTIACYRAIGGVTGALQRKADTLIAGFDPTETKQARRLLVRLVGGVDSDVALDTRRRVAIAKLQPSAPKEQAAFARVLDALVAARLLVRSDDSGVPVVEMAHEALIRKWELLQRWLAADREMLGELNEVEGWVQQWQTFGTLVEGNRLGYALRVQHKYPDALDSAARAMIAASVACDQRRKARTRRNLRLITLGTMATTLLAVVAVWQAQVATQEREVAKYARTEAETARENAEEQARIAEREEEKAKRAQENAEEQARIAKREKEKAKRAQQEAEKQARIAEREEEKAKRAQKEAEKQAHIAKKQWQRARRAQELEAQAREDAQNAWIAAEAKRREAEKQHREATRLRQVAEQERDAKQRLLEEKEQRIRDLLRRTGIMLDQLPDPSPAPRSWNQRSQPTTAAQQSMAVSTKPE